MVTPNAIQPKFEVVEVEKEFVGEIRNPDTGRQSQTFRIAGKVDGIVRCHDGLYLLEHKTVSTFDASYLDKLWTDTQIALYCYYLRELGYPIVGVIYNVLLKSRLKQGKGETQEEYEASLRGTCCQKQERQVDCETPDAETDDEFQSRLTEWYSRPEAFHREFIYLSEDRLAMLQDEVWRSRSNTSMPDGVANGCSTPRTVSRTNGVRVLGVLPIGIQSKRR